MGILEILLIAVPCGSAALAFLYGFFRKFSRVTWIGWQVLILFALTLLLDVIPPLSDKTLWFSLVVGAVFAVALLLLGGEYFWRQAILKRKFGKGIRVLGRFGGAFSAIAATLALEGVFIGLAFTVVGTLSEPPAIFSPVLESGIWVNFFSKHAYDLFVIALFFVFLRAGLRLGLVRAVYYLLMFALTFACFWGAFLLVTKVGFLDGWGNSLGAHFGTLLPAAASLVGHAIIGTVCFVVLFAVAMLFGALLHWLLRKFLSFRAVGLIDGLILCIVFAAVFVAFACGIHYALAKFSAPAAEGFLVTLSEYLRPVVSVVRSAPFARILYDCNPAVALLGL